MSTILQVVYFLCYGLAALAIAFMAPKIFPGTPHSVAWLGGAVVFLAGALMHEIASRCYQASLARHRLAVLHRAYVEAMDDIDRLAAELRAFKRTAFFEPGTDDAPVEAPARFDRPDVAPPEPVQAAPDTDAGTYAGGDGDVDGGATTAEATLQRFLVQRLYAQPGSGRASGGGMPRGGKTAVVSGSLIERETLTSVCEALRQSHLHLYLQPVVTLPQRKPRHFDCEVRLDSERGDFMPPALYNEILRTNGLKLPVDNMFLFRTVQLASKSPALEPGGYNFCRILPDSLSDRDFFHEFLTYLRDADDLVSGVAFEFREADLLDLDDAAADALGTLVELGFHLCVSQLHNFDVEADRLVEGGVRFIKVEAEMFMAATANEAEGARMRRFKSALDDAGIELIVTGIANEQLLVEILDFDIEYGQGPLFGTPRKSAFAPDPSTEGRRGRA